MLIDDSFALNTADMVVVVGVIANGEIRPGDKLLIETPYSNIPVTAEALEPFPEPLEYAKTGDRVGIKLKGATKDDAGPGYVLIGAK